MGRWAVYVDIEGFGELYRREASALATLRCLIEGVYLAGSRAFPKSPDRLFAHHVGDGFILVSEFGSQTLDVPICLAIGILRHVASTGWFCKAAVAEGDFADIRGCYPEVLREADHDACGRVALGDGLLTTLPVMGTALIRAVGISKKASGALLLVDAKDRDRVSTFRSQEVPKRAVVAIDWIHSEPPCVRELQQLSCLKAPTAAELERSLTAYCESEHVSTAWKENTRRFLGIG